MLSRDLQLFLIEKGEENAPEYQQRVIPILQDAKRRNSINVKQTVLEDFFVK